jgi:hypothetical protein
VRVSQTAEVMTHGDRNVLISEHQSSIVNFLLFLVPQKFRKFRKFTAHSPSRLQ